MRATVDEFFSTVPCLDFRGEGRGGKYEGGETYLRTQIFIIMFLVILFKFSNSFSNSFQAHTNTMSSK